MKAITWHGKHDVRCDTVDDPEILNPRDAIIRVTSTAICGSDLHLYDGFIPTMKSGDVLGHEFMGVVEEVGPASTLGHRAIDGLREIHCRPLMRWINENGRRAYVQGLDIGILLDHLVP